MTDIQTAIRRSITHTEIVTIEGDESTLRELEDLADDSAGPMLQDSGPMIRDDDGYEVGGPATYLTEFWGREDGDTWRVHVIHS